jgi:hypothetical protein
VPCLLPVSTEGVELGGSHIWLDFLLFVGAHMGHSSSLSINSKLSGVYSKAFGRENCSIRIQHSCLVCSQNFADKSLHCFKSHKEDVFSIFKKSS